MSEQIADLVSRVVPALVIAAAGIAYLLAPSLLSAVRPYFSKLRLDASGRARLDAVLKARTQAENVPAWLGRLLGAVSLGLAALYLAPGISPILPYTAWCLAYAAACLAAYVAFKRASDRRAAVLRSRHPFEALSLPVVGSLIAAVAAMFGIAAVTRDSYAALVAVGAAVAIWIGWRLAESPALVLGDDVAVEIFVDHRLRLMRAVNTAAIGIAPVVVYLGMRHPQGPAVLPLMAVVLVAWLPGLVAMIRANLQTKAPDALAAGHG